jgi:hypothetical protein
MPTRPKTPTSGNDLIAALSLSQIKDPKKNIRSRQRSSLGILQTAKTIEEPINGVA